MSRVFFAEDLESTATFWRIYRRDGVMVALTSHDRDLWFDGILHRASPGMLPSAIRRTADLSSDSADVRGALTHDSISAEDLAAGRFGGARVEMGLVDWETLARTVLYRGVIGEVTEEAGGFESELRSAKDLLEKDNIPRTSPTCRALFCGPGCTLSAARFTHEAAVAAIDYETNSVAFTGIYKPNRFDSGSLRWLDGPQAGLSAEIISTDGAKFVLDVMLDPELEVGARAILREGCDHTLATCTQRFANAVNFQGEPFLPGNDLITRYPVSSA